MLTNRTRCLKHPRFNPRVHSLADVKGGCKGCQALLALAAVISEFTRAHNDIIGASSA